MGFVAVAERSPRRRFRFTLRALLALIALVALLLGVQVQQAQRQRRAVARLEQLGASIRYDYQDGDLQADPPGPEWLRSILGIHYFATADFVFFHGQTIRDDDLQVVQELPNVKQVNLSQCSATGASLVHLQDLPKLVCIGLGGANATDEALGQIRGMTQLEVLSINLGQIGKLRNIGKDRVTDAGLSHIGGLKKLWRLDLDNCPITDAGLVQLGGLTELINLSLRGAGVSDEGVARLQKKLPKCKIFR